MVNELRVPLLVSGVASVGLGVVIVLLAGATSAKGDVFRSRLSPAEHSRLLRQFQPVTYLHKDELWAPAKVDAFLDASRLEERSKANGWRPSMLKQPPTSNGSCPKGLCYRLNLRLCELTKGSSCYERHKSKFTSLSRSAVYGTFVELDSAPDSLPPIIRRPVRYLLHYYYFYAYDDWRRPTGRFQLTQVHEADWERVTIGLSDETSPAPLFAAYTSHCGGTWRPWPSPEIPQGIGQVQLVRNSQHPKVFVSLGSHANYFSQSTRATRPIRCKWEAAERLALAKTVGGLIYGIVDRTGHKHDLGPKDVAARETELIELTAPLPRWARFRGYWSEGELLFVKTMGLALHRFLVGDGPSPPALFSTSVQTIFASRKWRQD